MAQLFPRLGLTDSKLPIKLTSWYWTSLIKVYTEHGQWDQGLMAKQAYPTNAWQSRFLNPTTLNACLRWWTEQWRNPSSSCMHAKFQLRRLEQKMLGPREWDPLVLFMDVQASGLPGWESQQIGAKGLFELESKFRETTSSPEDGDNDNNPPTQGRHIQNLWKSGETVWQREQQPWGGIVMWPLS